LPRKINMSEWATCSDVGNLAMDPDRIAAQDQHVRVGHLLGRRQSGDGPRSPCDPFGKTNTTRKVGVNKEILDSIRRLTDSPCRVTWPFRATTRQSFRGGIVGEQDHLSVVASWHETNKTTTTQPVLYINFIWSSPSVYDGDQIIDIASSLSPRDGKQDPAMHQPDAFFGCLNNPFWGLTLEVAYPQKSEQLEELAGFYLFEALLYARKVVRIRIDGDSSRKVTVNTWERGPSPVVCLAKTIHIKEAYGLFHADTSSALPKTGMKNISTSIPANRASMSCYHQTPLSRKSQRTPSA
jgi:hypothetical protein